jgi:competence protein ComGC
MKNSIKTLKAFNMVEIMIVVCLLVTTVILCIPTIFNNSKEAKIISGWKRIYAEMQSNFEVFNVSDADVIEKICRSNVAQKEPEIFKVISPYLNVDLSRNPNTLKSYHYKFKNGSQIPMQSMVFTRFFSYQENGNIVGFKWLDCECSEKVPCATVLFDMNGVEKRVFKYGVSNFSFGINRIEAFGAEFTNDSLERSCSSHSNGMSCSEYYLRGGKF